MTISPLKSIKTSDMKNIALGGSFLGTGGGGDPYIGRLMAEEAISKNGPVTVLDVDDIEDDALIIPVAMMGAPTVMLEKLPRGTEAISAVETLQNFLGKKATAIFCLEAGGLNLFKYIKGDKDSIMGLPVKQIINYIKKFKI